MLNYVFGNSHLWRKHGPKKDILSDIFFFILFAYPFHKFTVFAGDFSEKLAHFSGFMEDLLKHLRVFCTWPRRSDKATLTWRRKCDKNSQRHIYQKNTKVDQKAREDIIPTTRVLSSFSNSIPCFSIRCKRIKICIFISLPTFPKTEFYDTKFDEKWKQTSGDECSSEVVDIWWKPNEFIGDIIRRLKKQIV